MGRAQRRQHEPSADNVQDTFRARSPVYRYLVVGQKVDNKGVMMLRCTFCNKVFQVTQFQVTGHFTQTNYCKDVSDEALFEIARRTQQKFERDQMERVARYVAERGLNVPGTGGARGGEAGRRPVEGGVGGDGGHGAPNPPLGGGGGETEEGVIHVNREARGPGEEGVLEHEDVPEFYPSTGERLEDWRRRAGKGAATEGSSKRKEGGSDPAATPVGKRLRQQKVTDVYGGEWAVETHRAELAEELEEVRQPFWVTGATLLSDGRKSRDGRPIVNFLAAGSREVVVYTTINREGEPNDAVHVLRRWVTIFHEFSFRGPQRVNAICTDSVSAYVGAARALASSSMPLALRRITWLPLLALQDTLQDMMRGDDARVFASIPWSADVCVMARWVPRQIRWDPWWQRVATIVHIMQPVMELLRRMDRGGQYMSLMIEWTQDLVRRVTDACAPLGKSFTDWIIRRVQARTQHMLEPAHCVGFLLNPLRRHVRYFSDQVDRYHAWLVGQAKRYILTQTGFELEGADYILACRQIEDFHIQQGRFGDWGGAEGRARRRACSGDGETIECASWWSLFESGAPELQRCAFRVMHMWSCASPAERNWAVHEGIHTKKRNQLAFEKVVQLVEITANVWLTEYRRAGCGYVLPWQRDEGMLDCEAGLEVEPEEGAPSAAAVEGQVAPAAVPDATIAATVDEIVAAAATTMLKEMAASLLEEEAPAAGGAATVEGQVAATEGAGGGAASVEVEGAAAVEEEEAPSAAAVEGGVPGPVEEEIAAQRGGDDERLMQQFLTEELDPVIADIDLDSTRRVTEHTARLQPGLGPHGARTTAAREVPASGCEPQQGRGRGVSTESLEYALRAATHAVQEQTPRKHGVPPRPCPVPAEGGATLGESSGAEGLGMPRGSRREQTVAEASARVVVLRKGGTPVTIEDYDPDTDAAVREADEDYEGEEEGEEESKSGSDGDDDDDYDEPPPPPGPPPTRASTRGLLHPHEGGRGRHPTLEGVRGDRAGRGRRVVDR
ncbi:hypothetical protein CBR_g38581 [Chara braunii]|uniref:Uncharacterized protein n=1 Tax=Chara braunii TaxID=69332 RepID=A0A388K0M8_CHABU|nr:hypothetical protein CBR_g38581 [Chara braunii]|eukprot:GBG63513.1 hypothetical protein CBR_g38581 [Chara braunii]